MKSSTSRTVGIMDCTLRDGGYINDWNWGRTRAQDIIDLLSNAGIDMVEVGFLRNDAKNNINTTICDSIQLLNDFIPAESNGTIYAAMAMNGAYDVGLLEDYSGHGINLIRITAHENDIKDGMKMAIEVKKKKYKVAVNPINIMGYGDDELIELLKRTEDIHPFQFTIVDTFGSMRRRDLDRIVRLVDHNLADDIAIGLHLHENMSMSFSLAQQFLDYHLHRSVYIDGSLMGIGRNPGNLACELLADYLNDENGDRYDINDLMDAIENYIEPMKGKSKWGYAPAYFLSAKYNLHRNYAEFLISKGNLTNSDINKILSKVEKKYASVYSDKYIETLYNEYFIQKYDDKEYMEELKVLFGKHKLLILCPGKSISKHRNDIAEYIKNYCPLVIAVNFVPAFIDCDLFFFSNPIRKKQINNINSKGKLLLTSNICDDDYDYKLDYSKLLKSGSENCNGFLMLLRLVEKFGIREVAVAGADGYEGSNDYYDTYLSSRIDRNVDYNNQVKCEIANINLSIDFITESAYSQ